MNPARLHHPAAAGRRRSATHLPWVDPLHLLIQQNPTFGYQHLCAGLHGQEGIIVNRKAVYRVLKQKQWLVHLRSCTPRPRFRGWVSRNIDRWAMDECDAYPVRPGWLAHLAAVIACHDRKIVGYEFALCS